MEKYRYCIIVLFQSFQQNSNLRKTALIALIILDKDNINKKNSTNVLIFIVL